MFVIVILRREGYPRNVDGLDVHETRTWECFQPGQGDRESSANVLRCSAFSAARVDGPSTHLRHWPLEAAM